MKKSLSLVENFVEPKKITSYEKRLLKVIHDKVWEKHADDPRLIYDIVERLKNGDAIFLYRIYNFLKNIMGYDDPKKIEYLIKLFINNFQEDGDYSKLTTQEENIIPGPNYHHQAVANNLNLPPILVIDMKETWDREMPIFHDIVNDDHYQVGTEKETLRAINDSMQDRYYNFSEAAQFEGTVNGLVNYLYIDDTDKRIIASEYAESAESENHINDIIRMFLDYEYTEEDRLLLKKYIQLRDQLRDKEGHDPTDYSYVSGKVKMVDDVTPTIEMSQIGDSIRERFREIVYDDEYDKMDNNIVDWLMDHGYLTQDQNWGDYSFTEAYLNKWKEVDVSKLPKWLNFDREEFIDDMATIDRAGELSNIDDYYDTETINDDTYYIIHIDY